MNKLKKTDTKLFNQLKKLDTEQRNSATQEIDLADSREIVRLMFQEYDDRLGVVLTRAQEIENGLVNKTTEIDGILTNTREQVLYVHNQLLEVEPRHLAMEEKLGPVG